MKVLDVGCGSHKRGDVGIDKEPGVSVDHVLDLDIYHIPYPQNSFDLAIAHHSIEHFTFPSAVIKEMLRVSPRVRLTVPHRYSCYSHCRGHRQWLNKRWFLKLGRILGVETSVKITFKPLIYLGPVGLFMRPHELLVEYWRNYKIMNVLGREKLVTRSIPSQQLNTIAESLKNKRGFFYVEEKDVVDKT